MGLVAHPQPLLGLQAPSPSPRGQAAHRPLLGQVGGALTGRYQAGQ